MKAITGSAGREQAAAVGTQLLLLVPLHLGWAGWLAGAGYAAALWFILTIARHRTGARSFGPADHVTLARAVLVGCVMALVAAHAATGPLFVAVASVALALDAVDGLVARRTGTVSALGARFDMEVDAFLILLLSIQASASLGVWVLAIGLMRYLFVAASRPLPWLRAPLPPSFARKTVAALQGILLVAATSGVFPHPAAIALAAVSLATLTWSFGRDVRWLWRRRAPAPPLQDAVSPIQDAVSPAQDAVSPVQEAEIRAGATGVSARVSAFRLRPR
ncbi:CDP-alcohol phosphatidyltransferase family protein [Amycolatopsis taiwanensis]|uniref:CDP-alcohol phosphatidyltransferase family protein n=1 Tax=Amycolatopsis taiwanensis TaxID=342230 RepID=UPI0006933378